MSTLLIPALACSQTAGTTAYSPDGRGAGAASGIEPVRFVLDNGLTVLVAEDHSAPVAAVQVWVATGSADEQDSEAGLAHVHEHMLFKGTEKRGIGEIAREVEAAGGEINAYTSKDVTVYHVTIASRFLDTALDVLSDAVFHSTFDAGELAKELEVVLEEYRRGEDSPERKIYELLFETAYREHSYRRSTIGDWDVISNLKREDVVRFFERWYVPSNMTLVVTGDVDVEALKPRVEELFGSHENRPVPARPRPAEPPQQETRIRVERGPFKKTLVYLGYPAPDVRDADVAAVDAMSAILGDGESARMWRNVKTRRELVHSVFTYAMTPRDPGLFIVGMELDPDKLEDAVHAVLEELEEIQDIRPQPTELARAVRGLESDFVYEKETAQGNARALGFYETLAHDWRFEPRYLEALGAVTPEDVRAVASEMLDPSKLSLVVLLPEDARPDLDAGALEKVVREATADAETLGGDVRTEDDFTVETLPNGITLVIRDRPGVEVVSFVASFLGGARIEPEGRGGISTFMGRTLTRGTETMNAEELARAVDELAGSLDGFSGRNSFGVRGHFLARDLEPALDLASDVLLRPTFPAEEVEKERDDLLHDIEIREDNLARLAFEEMAKILYGGHPAGNPITGTEESVRGISAEDLRDFYGRYARPAGLVISVVGNVDPARVRHAVHERFGSWNGDGRATIEVPPVPPLGDQRTLFIERPDKNQSHVVLAFPGVTIDHPDRYAIELLTTVLSGQGGRLFRILRDERSLAYSVTAFSRDGLDPGYIGAYIASAPDKTDEALTGLAEQLEIARLGGVTPEELEDAKRHLVGGFEIALQSSSNQSEGFGLYELFGLGYREYLRYPEKLLEVTAEDVARVAREYLDPEKRLVVIVGPSNATLR